MSNLMLDPGCGVWGVCVFAMLSYAVVAKAAIIEAIDTHTECRISVRTESCGAANYARKLEIHGQSTQVVRFTRKGILLVGILLLTSEIRI